MVCKVTLLFLFGFLSYSAKPANSISMLGGYRLQAGKGLISGQYLSSTRTHKDSVRAAFVLGRGAITSRKSQLSLCLEIFSGASILELVSTASTSADRFTAETEGNALTNVTTFSNIHTLFNLKLHFKKEGQLSLVHPHVDEARSEDVVLTKPTALIKVMDICGWLAQPS
eukprot:1138656-Pelagomonas_calceolata.AAC.2